MVNLRKVNNSCPYPTHNIMLCYVQLLIIMPQSAAFLKSIPHLDESPSCSVGTTQKQLCASINWLLLVVVDNEPQVGGHYELRAIDKVIVAVCVTLQCM